jgi:peptide/nickel transport system permease protein
VIRAARARLSRSASVVTGAAILAAILTVAVAAPWISRGDPEAIAVTRRLQPPSASAWLGTDHIGRDVLTRIVHGGRISLLVGAGTASAATAAGIVLGLIGGYAPRGELVMRVVDGLMAFPGTILALALVAVLGPQLLNTIAALAIVYTPRVARVEHASVVQIRRREYVQAAEGLGATGWRILGRHILPNTFGPLLVQSTFTFANAVIAEAGLSFLGVGIPPAIPSWGNLIAGGRDFMLVAPVITVAPGVAIFLLVLGLNLLGDGLRDVFDPRLRGRRGAATVRRGAEALA